MSIFKRKEIKRQKPWFDRFLEEHPRFPLAISCVSLVVSMILFAIRIALLIG